MSLNLRSIGGVNLISPIVYSNDRLEISALQDYMLKFSNENARCVINASRRVGKSTFLIMSALLSSNTKISIICGSNMDQKKSFVSLFIKFLKNADIDFNFVSGIYYDHISIDNKHILIYDENGYIDKYTRNEDELYIDEYDGVNFRNIPYLKNKTKIIAIGTKSPVAADYTEDEVGLFAGLNVTE